MEGDVAGAAVADCFVHGPHRRLRLLGVLALFDHSQCLRCGHSHLLRQTLPGRSRYAIRRLRSRSSALTPPGRSGNTAAWYRRRRAGACVRPPPPPDRPLSGIGDSGASAGCTGRRPAGGWGTRSIVAQAREPPCGSRPARAAANCEARNMHQFGALSGSLRPTRPPPSVPLRTAMKTRWPRPSTVPSRPSWSSIKGPGGTLIRSNVLSFDGSAGTTASACTQHAVTSHPRNSRPSTTDPRQH